jgi:hypothetical protein
MKKFYAILCIAIASLTQLQAQAPQGFNYQATVRNSTGDLIINTNVYFKFNIIQGSQTSLPVFTEIHYVPTDDLGQVNLVIGQGTPTTGTFSALDWSQGSYYLGIELDTGNGYVAMGTTQLLSVPYALYAENSGNSTPTTPNLQSVLAENNSANNQQIKDLQDPTEAQDAVTKNYVDTEIENSVPDIEQVLTQGNDANGLQLKGLADPTEAQDAVTKTYFENNTSSSGLAPGNTVGDMLYWDGENWAQIPSPENNATLKFCDGQLTWGGCRPNILIHECMIGDCEGGGRIFYDLYPNGSIVSSIELLLSQTNNLPDENDLVVLSWPQEWTEYTYQLNDEISICGVPTGTYYVRAKVESNLGTSYSETIQVVIDQNNSCLPEPIQMITTVRIQLTTDAGDEVQLLWQDLDGDGPNEPVITVSGEFNTNSYYFGSITVLNESEVPAENITEVIIEEADEHQFFYQFSEGLEMTSQYSDQDSNGNPVGVQFTVITGSAGSGNFTVVPRHEPMKPNNGLVDAGGETDIQISFPIVIN